MIFFAYFQRGGSIRKKKRKKSSAEDAQSQGADDVFLDGAAAYDPNEPLYCTCRQISFGNMIACENPDCSIEWFHFACVGLKAEVSASNRVKVYCVSAITILTSPMHFCSPMSHGFARNVDIRIRVSDFSTCRVVPCTHSLNSQQPR